MVTVHASQLNDVAVAVDGEALRDAGAFSQVVVIRAGTVGLHVLPGTGGGAAVGLHPAPHIGPPDRHFDCHLERDDVPTDIGSIRAVIR